MYNFTDTNAIPEAFNTLAMDYGGLVFEEEISGYRTLNVGGRELISNELEIVRGVGMDGSTVVGETLPSRTLVIQYMLKASSKEECLYNFEKLNYLLRSFGKNQVAITFSDEQNRTYYGRFSEATEVPFDRNTVVGTFTIFCSDPYKYNSVVVYSGTSVTIGTISDYEMKPELIKLTLGSNASKITITNSTTGKRIILNGTYTSGQVLLINIKGRTVTVNGQNKKMDLDFVESDFYSFGLSNGDTVTSSPTGTLEITTRGRVL